MQKVIAISFLFIFMCHILGYYFFYVTSKYQINKDWEKKVEQQRLKEQDLNYMALPISYPYQQNQELYHKVNESMEFGGNFYRVIKKRYANDTLHIIYVDDIKTQKLKKSFKDWVNTIFQEKNPDSKREIMLSSFDKNFFLNNFNFHLPAPGDLFSEFSDFYILNFYDEFFTFLEHPPKI